ncbi:MAG: lamin tail domain-containing protein [Chloroflexota bacterium]
MGRHFFALVISLALLLVGFPTGAAPASALSAGVVISQVYGGGGNGGATYTHDFVELFNRGTTAVSLAGWSIQYASATGTGNFGASSAQLTELSGVLAPGQYLLIQEASNAGVGAPLPAADIVDATPIAMAAGAGKVALVNSPTSLGCNGGSAPCSSSALAAIVDLVGYGSANFFEGAAAAPTLSSTTAGLRSGGGCVETDNNASDFTAATPAPRNQASPTRSCDADPAPAVTGTTPANGAGAVALNANVTVTFSENVVVLGTWFSISCSLSGAHTATVSGASPTFTLDPDVDFNAGETCTTTVLAAQVTDQDANDPPDNMAANYLFSFATIAPATRIHTIQGASHRSALTGTLVLNVPGIVTAKASNGFYIQDPAPDADPATSEAIFVFTSTAPPVTVGDSVSAKGTVQEFRPGGAATTNLTTTELANPGVGVTVFSSGNPLPATVVIGVDRTPPSEVIEDDAAGSVETSGVFDPASDGIDFWESLEAMRLQLNNAQAVGPRNNFGEIALVASGAGIRTARGGIVIRANDFNPERVIIDDVLMATPSANTGDTFTGATIGVLDYNFGNFKLLVTQVGTVTSGGIGREVTASASPGELAVATFNVENLDPSDGVAQFNALAQLIVNNLRSPDILALEEIQDNSGAVNNGVVDATVTLTMLRDAVVAAGGPLYAWRLIDPVNNQDGGEPGGNIRQAFFFRGDRGLSFVDRPGGTSTSSTGVVAGPGGPQLTASPGRVDPTNPAFTTSRKPLAGEFLYDAQRLFVVANHFNSKGGDQPLFGHPQPPVRVSEVQRIQQAQVLAGFVAQILALDPEALVAVIGDLNDFEFSPALSVLEAAGLTTLIETLPQSERYSYVFDGNSQTLDHMQVSAGLLASLIQFDSVHVNSEFADQISDHDPQAARFGLTVTEDALCALVESMVQKAGIANALCAKLEAAAASDARGNHNAKAGQIGAFINQVDAQRGKSISDADATRLIALAEAL